MFILGFSEERIDRCIKLLKADRSHGTQKLTEEFLNESYLK